MEQKFVEMLSEDMKPIHKILRNTKPMSMSEAESKRHAKTKKNVIHVELGLAHL